jgi:hypothetical protein
MTPERRKALLMMAATFVAGIAIGALVIGMLARQFYHGHGGKHGEGKEMRDGRRGTLTEKIFKIVKADESQKKLMKPIIDKTISGLDEIEDKSNQDAYAQLDSLKVKLSPILAPDQVEKLNKFLSAKRKSHEEEEKREFEEEHGHH